MFKRLCCGEEHWGAVCPNGTVMCCICFNKFKIDELYTDSEGTWDICKECGEEDANNRP